MQYHIAEKQDKRWQHLKEKLNLAIVLFGMTREIGTSKSRTKSLNSCNSHIAAN